MRDRAVSSKLASLYSASRAPGTLYALILYFRGEREKLANSTIYRLRRCGREAEGGGLLNRYRVVKPYRGFESLRLRHPSPCRASGGRPSGDGQGEGCLPKLRPERRKTVAHLWYVYFLELSNGDIYVGSTDDFRRRLASHRQGRVVSTSKHLPAVLRSYVAVADEATARLGR